MKSVFSIAAGLVMFLASCSSKKGEEAKPVDLWEKEHKNPFITHLYTADPSAHVWADGRLYVYPSHDIDPPRGGVCKGGKLKDNMMEIDGSMQHMTGLVDFHEAAWVHKRNNIYYLSYSDNHDEANLHNQMRYATSSSPLGPWTYRGIYMDPTDSYTNHGSIVEYKGQWWAFYHNSSKSKHDWLRTICADKLSYTENGMIKKVIQTAGKK